MRILVVGGGGREHALAWRLAHEAEVICAPGNPGIAADVETVPVAASDVEGLVALARSRGVDLVVVGPEDPLVDGLGDRLRAEGFLVYGPDAAGARLEASKAFSKELMAAAGVPTAPFQTFTAALAAREYARSRFDLGRGVAVKASGNALGKGVVVCGEYLEAEEAIGRMLEAREFGDAGAEIVVEDRLNGPEFSLLTLVSGAEYRSLPVAQDHKRAHDGDLGPNTGGMGTYAPVHRIPPAMVEETEARVVAPILAELARRGIAYRGTLFSGLLVDGGTAYCLEYNVRFGDPETQSVMRLVGAGFAETLRAAAAGEGVPEFETVPGFAATVVVASGGYPGPIEKGLPIQVGPLPDGAKLFHAGTAEREGTLVTSGGRVIGASGFGTDLSSAVETAYAAARAVSFENAFFRRDIGR